MATTHPDPVGDNPAGTDGFEFVEFTAPDPRPLEALFERLGFVATHRHPTQDVVRYAQGDVNLLLNRHPEGHAAAFRDAHGPSAAGMAFRVNDAKRAYEVAMANGAKDANEGGVLDGDFPVIEGIGGSLLYLVDRYGDKGSIYDRWDKIEGAEDKLRTENMGFEYLDHLTHNVNRGNMRTWSTFYSKVFGFREQKYFDIKGQASGLVSQAMISPDGKIRIPLNESQDEHSQIEEFLREYKGEGIQHLAFGMRDIFESVETLRERGVRFQDTIETYYDLIDKRVPGHGHDVERMRKDRILIDGNDEEGLLLQIFTENLCGPIFFELIQRKGNQAFGEGNFRALFESIELDQIRRGVIQIPQPAE